MKSLKFVHFCTLAILGISNIHAEASTQLKEIYETHCKEWSDIYEHLPRLSALAQECSSVLELGLRTMVSSWGLLHGLSNSSSSPRHYIGIDIDMPPSHILSSAKLISESNDIVFEFYQANDLHITPIEADMLFIDTLHTYCQLTYELETFSPKIHKYIVMHDTSASTELADEIIYKGDYSEYPSYIDKTKRGLWPAVEDFLKNHPEWILEARYTNNYGLTVLRRNY